MQKLDLGLLSRKHGFSSRVKGALLFVASGCAFVVNQTFCPTAFLKFAWNSLEKAGVSIRPLAWPRVDSSVAQDNRQILWQNVRQPKLMQVASRLQHLKCAFLQKRIGQLSFNADEALTISE